MNEDNTLIVCRGCGRKVLMHNMRPDSSGENMICNDCFKKQGAADIRMEQFRKAEASTASKAKSSVSEKMIKYICTGCKYKFSRKESRPVEKCPYCGKGNIVLDSNTGADQILKDSTNKRFETW